MMLVDELADKRRAYAKTLREIRANVPERLWYFNGAPRDVLLMVRAVGLQAYIQGLEFHLEKGKRKRGGAKMDGYTPLFKDEPKKKGKVAEVTNSDDATPAKFSEVIMLLKKRHEIHERIDALMEELGRALGVDYKEVREKIKKEVENG